ncbi:MAG TPA: hypothetical protein VF952_02455 [Chloroflexia bacterium]|jgi:hypothetical protein
MPVDTKLKRYNLALPHELFDQLEAIAEENHTTVVEVLRRFIKLGLVAVKAQKEENTTFLIREGEKEREILVIF